MRAIIIFLLLCLPAFGADVGVRSVSTVTTNEDGAILTNETFTRGGQTNLVRITRIKHGAVVFQRHQFCHHGEPVAMSTWMSGVQHFHTYPGTPYSADIEYWPSKEVRCVMVTGRGYLDGFYCTNGIYTPAPDSDLEMKDVKQ